MCFLVPGLIVLFIRSQFVIGGKRKYSAEILHYIMVSLVYYALALPFFGLMRSPDHYPHTQVLAWFSMIFVGPAILGVLLGINIQKNRLRRFCQWCGLNPVHAIPTAWDWKFRNMPPQWVFVTLKDDTQFAGFCGLGSFMSSDPAERDVYIEKIYDIDEDNNWSSRGENSLLIAPGEVKTIEFWPCNPQEEADEQS